MVVLSCNKLSLINPRWFKKPSSLEVLDLSGNEITLIPEYTFKHFTNLQEINFNFNKIKTVGHNSFVDCVKLYVFRMANNEILEIPTDVLPQMKMKFDIFHIQNNRLTYLPKDLMKRVTSSFGLVDGNPWRCSCWYLIQQWNSQKWGGHVSINTGKLIFVFELVL